MQATQPKAICLMGPTASGKTDLALSMAASGDFEIINVDPAQMYRGMDIGTGKPSQAIRDQIPHHLIDCLDPKHATSAGQFVEAATKAMDDITARGKTPLLVGGTMLYFKALQEGLSPLPSASQAIRDTLQAEIQSDGLAALYERLQEIDPVFAQQIKPTDPQRIVRALEIAQISGHPPSYWHAQPKQGAPYAFSNVALMPLEDNRAQLHTRIEKRFDNMLEAGLIQEVKTIWDWVEHDADLPSMRAVGYRQVIGYLQGIDNYDQMREKAIAATRQLAKRQLTWLRQWPNCHTVDFQIAEKQPDNVITNIIG